MMLFFFEHFHFRLDVDYKLFLSSAESFLEKYANDSNIINLGLILDQIKVSSSLIISSSWIYSYYLRTNPTTLLVFDLLDRITSFEDFRLVSNYLLSSKNMSSINKRIEIIEYSIKLIHTKDDEQWRMLEEILNNSLSCLKIFIQLSTDYSQDELNQLEQCKDIQEQEQTLSNLLCTHGKFDLIIYLRRNLFHEISMSQILQRTIEEIDRNIK